MIVVSNELRGQRQRQRAMRGGRETHEAGVGAWARASQGAVCSGHGGRYVQ